jgi:RimJ/RimL family protein N-acetyltransferase
MKVSCFPNVIAEEKVDIRLEAFSLANQEELWRAIQEDRDNPKRKGIWPGIDSFTALKSYMDSCDIGNPKSEEFGYVIRDIENVGVGTFHIFSVDWNAGSAEVGFGLHLAFEGKGFASKALKLMEQALQDLGFERINITCKVWNARSWAVAERANYNLIKVFHKDQECAGCDNCTKVYQKVLG